VKLTAAANCVETVKPARTVPETETVAEEMAFEEETAVEVVEKMAAKVEAAAETTNVERVRRRAKEKDQKGFVS
jgi:hypothetical protein